MNSRSLIKKLQALTAQYESTKESGDVMGMVGLIFEFRDLRVELIDLSISSGVIKTETDQERALVRAVIKDDPSFPLNSALTVLFEKILPHNFNGTAAPEIFSQEAFQDLAEEHFDSWFSSWGYISAMMQVGSIVVHADVDEHLKTIVDEIKQCYAFEQYHAVVILCRTLLETSMRSIGVRQGEITEDYDTQKFYDNYPPSKLFEIVSKGLFRKELSKIYYEISEIVHGLESVDNREAVEVMKKTFSYVERMWDYNFDNEK